MELKPLLNNAIKEILCTQQDEIFNILNCYGSPTHIVFPQLFSENYEEYRAIFSEHKVDGKIYYAYKSNKANSFLEMAANKKSGVEVASIYELRQALSRGVNGKDIIISGPAKGIDFLLLAIQQGCLISIDDIIELNKIAQIIDIQQFEGKVKVLLRVNNLYAKTSRFGIPLIEMKEIYSYLQHRDRIDLRGFSFHLNNYSIEDRINAIDILIDETIKARDIGFNCDIIDIGGGFTVQYIESDSWDHFNMECNDNKLGLFFNNKEFDGFYPYYNTYAKGKFLERILLGKLDSKKSTIRQVLNELKIRLIIEPGRSLLDQCGITLMTVKSIKRQNNGEYIIQVDANINHLSEQWFNSDFLIDPILLSKSNKKNGLFTGAIAGNLCLEQDMLSWRKISFYKEPEEGDLIIYANTAGYQMDSNESTFHQIPIPEKLCCYKVNDRWRWKLDSRFSQINLYEGELY